MPRQNVIMKDLTLEVLLISVNHSEFVPLFGANKGVIKAQLKGYLFSAISKTINPVDT